MFTLVKNLINNIYTRITGDKNGLIGTNGLIGENGKVNKK
jgi:hypothetical protein